MARISTTRRYPSFISLIVLLAFASTAITRPATAGHTEAEMVVTRADTKIELVTRQAAQTGGVSGDRGSTVESGLNKSVATNATAAGRQPNRRVEITLLKQPGA